MGNVLPRNSLSTKRIFSTNALKCRTVIEAIWRATDKTQRLPSEIISLCAKYYLIVLFPPPLPSQNYYLFNEEYIFKNLSLTQSTIFGVSRTLKLTVLNDLYIGTDSSTTTNHPCKIRCYRGSIILNVFGNIHLGRNCTISTECTEPKQAIYIKCNNFYMHKGSEIRSFSVHSYLHHGTLFGSLIMNIAHNLDIADECDIMTGIVDVKCGGYTRIGRDNGKVNIVAMDKLHIKVGDRLFLHNAATLCTRKKKQFNKVYKGRLRKILVDYVNI